MRGPVDPLLPSIRQKAAGAHGSQLNNSIVKVAILAALVAAICLCVVTTEVWANRAVILGADKPWGVDFDIKYSKKDRQWQITNLVLHPPPPAPAGGKEPPQVMTKPTFPFFELEAMNTMDADAKKKLSDDKVDPKLKEKIEEGMKMKSSALDSAIGCPEGSEPTSSIKTACPGVGSGKPQVVKRQWNMGFPPMEGAANQQASAYKYRGLSGSDVDRGQTDEFKGK